MGNIYIEVDENFRVTKIHRMPFDPNNGMGYTREELEKKGFFVNEIPNPVNQTGRRAIAMYNPDTKSIYYEYIGVPMSDKERIEYLENALTAMLNMMISPTVTLYSDETEQQSTDTNTKFIGEYLAYQIISGKMGAQETIRNYPEHAIIIKEVLMENGIQV